MNETVLALMSAIAIYGLSSLAFSGVDADPRDDGWDIQAGETADTALSASTDETTSREEREV
jgi:hypothetical protein